MLAPVRCCRKELPIEYVKTALRADKEDLKTYLRFLKERKWTESDLISDAEYATVVKSMGAKQCPGCGIGVERDFGCIHMRCPNGHEFCFTCLRVWQTCNCALIPQAEINAILGPE
ncbi:hypothetical protein Poli38472_002823 [Pythium oligandrum]|uniref:IBR domain-containing protein n=1 Tax=Pythium oligandrum TaxID=41045 RepID=A0A8K1C5P8_PYTOL|nr:hypothetical protein Poli38472_002823 [Pythium oligandrum]|eukprot:TMW56898.1 hypothetical protein Poli38472_002823 [Pythium oligandrum]